LNRESSKALKKALNKESLCSCYEFARKLLLRNLPLEENCKLADLTMEKMKGWKLTLGYGIYGLCENAG